MVQHQLQLEEQLYQKVVVSNLNKDFALYRSSYNSNTTNLVNVDTKEAERIAKANGYQNAHELKKDCLKGQKDKTISHYDIKYDKYTKEVYLERKPTHGKGKIATGLKR